MHKEFFGDDSNLVEACINTDLTAWAFFVKKYSSLISISIRNRLKKYGFSLPREDIEDIKQNVLASIWKGRKLADVKNRKNVSYWLSIVAGNASIAYIRKKQTLEPVKPISLFDRVDEEEVLELVPSCQMNQKDEVSKFELSKKIDESIESLPTKEKLIIKLNLIHDKKYEEIADILKLPKGTVSSYLKRAKEKLKEALRDFR